MGNKIKLSESQLKGLVTRVAKKLITEEKKFTVIDNKMFPTHYGDLTANSLEELDGNLRVLMNKHGIENYDFKINSDGLSNVVFVDVVDTFMDDNIERLKQKYPELIFIARKDKRGYYYIELGKRIPGGDVYRINSLSDTTGKSGIKSLEGWAEIYYKQNNLTPKNNITESILFEVYDIWNDLIKIRNQHKPGDDIYEKASMYLRQLKTAGGSDMIGREVESFLDEIDGALSLEQLQQKYPQIKFTMDKKGEDRYFVRADIKTQGGEMEYLGAVRGPVSYENGLEFLNNIANNNYDKYY
jgi:hypothetical protein